jgi:prepilin signal peptidase PulO-like enzyme (type II secretory pathway)
VGPFFLGLHLLRDWIFTAFLVLIFTYDLRYMLIPDRFTIPAMGLAILLNLWGGILPAWSMLAGAVVLAGFFWIQFTLSRGNWVGGGDIRMGALMGCMLGLHQGIVALFLAYVLGAIIGVVMMMCGKATRKTPVPCGSFLAAGTLLTMGVGESILLWYFHLFL